MELKKTTEVFLSLVIGDDSECMDKLKEYLENMYFG